MNKLIQISPLTQSQEFLPQIHRHYKLDSYESNSDFNSIDEEKEDQENIEMLGAYEDDGF